MPDAICEACEEHGGELQMTRRHANAMHDKPLRRYYELTGEEVLLYSGNRNFFETLTKGTG